MSEEKLQIPTWSVKIHEARKAKGWTQERLAEELGVSQSTITDWERGRTFPRYKNMFYLSKILGIKIKEEVETDMKLMSKKSKQDTLQKLEFQNLSKGKQLDLFIDRFADLTINKCNALGIRFPIQQFTQEAMRIWMHINDPIRGMGADSIELRLEHGMQDFLQKLDENKIP